MFASPPESRPGARSRKHSPSRSDSGQSGRAFPAAAESPRLRWLPARSRASPKRPPFARCHRPPDASVDSSSASDRNHHPTRLIALPEIMLLGFSFDDVEEEPFQFRVRRSGAHHLHDVELEITSETRPELSVAGQPQLVAALAKMQIAHRPDKPDPLIAPRNPVI